MNNKYNFLAVLLVCFFAGAAFSQTSKATVSFTVLDENDNFVSGLNASDIKILQGKKSLPIDSVESKTGQRLEVVIMIDASTSQERMLPIEKKVAEYFVDNVLKKETDKVAVVKFTGVVSVEQEFTNDFSKAKEKINKIESEPPIGYIGGSITVSRTPAAIDAKGSTSIWDSVKQISETVSKSRSDNCRRAIILISDGVNTFGETKLKEAIDASIKNRIPVYAVGIGDDDFGGVDKKTLKKLTEQASGVLILPKENLKNLPPLMKGIEQSLRSTYQITFTTDGGATDALRETEVEVINPALRKRKLQVIQSRGYFLP